MLSIANLRCCATFETVQNFQKTYLFSWNSSSFSKVLRKLPISGAFYCKIATFSHFELNSIFENPFTSCVAAKLLKVLRSFTVPVAFYSKLATSSHYWKTLDSFWKTHLFSKPAQIFWTFWEVLLILSHSTAKLLPLNFFQKSWFFVKTQFLFQKTRIHFGSKNHTILVSFCTHLLTFSPFEIFQFFRWKFSSIFWNPQNFERFRDSYYFSRFYNKHASLSFFGNSKTLYRKTDVFFRKNTNSQPWTCWEALLYQSHSTASLLLFASFKNFSFLARNPSNFSKNPNFDRLQKSYYLSRNLSQDDYKLIKKILKHWINQR